MTDINILQETQNLLFKRKEIIAELEQETIPSSANVAKLIADKFSKSVEGVAVKKIGSNFGSKTFTITANVYETQEDKEKTEPRAKGKKAKAEAPAKVAETPKEDVKEEKKE